MTKQEIELKNDKSLAWAKFQDYVDFIDYIANHASAYELEQEGYVFFTDLDQIATASYDDVHTIVILIDGYIESVIMYATINEVNHILDMLFGPSCDWREKMSVLLNGIV